jgi:uncharacterized membrane protein YdbT with pleckstrin-like domain
VEVLSRPGHWSIALACQAAALARHPPAPNAVILRRLVKHAQRQGVMPQVVVVAVVVVVVVVVGVVVVVVVVVGVESTGGKSLMKFPGRGLPPKSFLEQT